MRSAPTRVAASADPLILAVTGEPRTFELRDADVARGRVVVDSSPHIVIGDVTWQVTVRRPRLSAYAVAYRRDAERADVAYYPHWLPGGTIAFDERRYGLRPNLVTWRWRIRDDRLGAIASMHSRARSGQSDLPIELDPRARARKEIWLLLLFASWAVLTAPITGPGPGANG